MTNQVAMTTKLPSVQIVFLGYQFPLIEKRDLGENTDFGTGQEMYRMSLQSFVITDIKEAI